MHCTRGQGLIKSDLRRTYTQAMVKKARQPQKVAIGGSLVAGVSSHGLTEPDHVSSSFSRPSLLPQPPHTKMSVSLSPSTSLNFRSILLFYYRNGHPLIFFE